MYLHLSFLPSLQKAFNICLIYFSASFEWNMWKIIAIFCVVFHCVVTIFTHSIFDFRQNLLKFFTEFRIECYQLEYCACVAPVFAAAANLHLANITSVGRLHAKHILYRSFCRSKWTINLSLRLQNKSKIFSLFRWPSATQVHCTSQRLWCKQKLVRCWCESIRWHHRMERNITVCQSDWFNFRY